MAGFVKIIGALLLLAIGLCFYFLPGFIVYFKRHRYQNIIILINFFLGWTLIGWVGCLVWAIWPKPKQKKETVDDLLKYKVLLDNGLMTYEEFEAKKEKILNN